MLWVVICVGYSVTSIVWSCWGKWQSKEPEDNCICTWALPAIALAVTSEWKQVSHTSLSLYTFLDHFFSMGCLTHIQRKKQNSGASLKAGLQLYTHFPHLKKSKKERKEKNRSLNCWKLFWRPAVLQASQKKYFMACQKVSCPEKEAVSGKSCVSVSVCVGAVRTRLG